MSILLTAILKAQTGKSAALKALLLELVPPSQAETACIQYDLHESREEPGLFIFHEEWADQAGFEAHQQAPHHQQFAAAVQDLLDGEVVIHHTRKIA